MEEIDLLEMVRKLVARWKYLLLCCAIGAVSLVILSIGKPATYTVTTKLAPELTSGKSLLGNLSAMVAGSSSLIGTTDAVFPDLYPDMIEAQDFQVSLFDMPVSVYDRKRKLQIDTTLYAYLKDYQKKYWLSSVIGFPMKMMGKAMDLFKDKDGEQSASSSDIDLYHLTKEQSRIASALKKSIKVKIDKKTFVLTAKVSSQDPKVAADIATAMIDKLQEKVTEYRTGKEVKNLEYFQMMHDQQQEIYNEALRKYGDYSDSNQGMVSARSKNELKRLQNDVNLHYQLYMRISEQLQLQKSKVQLETPVVAVLQAPSVPVKPSSKGKSFMFILGAFLGLCAGMFWVLCGKDIWKELRG